MELEEAVLANIESLPDAIRLKYYAQRILLFWVGPEGVTAIESITALPVLPVG